MAQRQPAEICALTERMCVTRAIGQHHQRRRRAHRIDYRRKGFFGLLVDPVQVLDQDHQRTPATLLRQQRAQGVQNAGTPLHRVHRRDRLVSRVHVQQILQVRNRLPRRLAPVACPLVDLRDDLFVVVAFLDGEVPLDQVADRQVWNALAVRDAVTLQPRERLIQQRSPELQEQPRLSESRFARDEHDLPAPPLRLVEVPPQEAQLLLAPNKRR